MRKVLAASLLVSCLSIASSALGAAKGKGVEVIANEASQRVDVTIDGKPFTSYIWPNTIRKPVLFPLIDADGVTLTRGFPPGPSERVDHPHHVGLWFNYARVNNFDFWNNSEAIKPENLSKMGVIRFDKILSTSNGPARGELVTLSTWIDGNNHPILQETTRFVFSSRKGARVIDRIATLFAIDHVVFEDEKDGMLGLRVASWLESPTAKDAVFIDSHGVQTKTGAASPDASGVYLTSEGAKGDAAWSTRGQWCSLTGHTSNDHVDTIAIIDHPGNPGYPTYWHARGYGLFAANPLGRSIFDPKQPPFNYSLDKGQQTTFRYRVVIADRAETADELNKEADAFAAEYK
jgi:hypothetical protein